MLLLYLGLLWRKETTSPPRCDLLHENVARNEDFTGAIVLK